MQNPTMIRREALYFVLGNAMVDNMPCYVPECLGDYSLKFGRAYEELDIEEYYTGVIHPVTNHKVVPQSSRGTNFA